MEYAGGLIERLSRNSAAFQRKIHESIEMPQHDPDERPREENGSRPQAEAFPWKGAYAYIPGFPGSCKRENVAV